MIVSIAGRPGSGKSTVAKALATRLGLDHVSAGDFMREMAGEHGVSVLEFGAIAEQDSGIDRAIDARSREMGESRDNFIIDARLAWYFIPHSIKVFLDVSLEVSAQRIFGDHRGSETENIDLQATMHNIERRAASESKRYDDYYGIDYLDPKNYDLVIDTSSLDVDEVVDAIADFLAQVPAA
ncbi:MAG: nucleoside monophosphate kinase [Acidimicrobiia bacterium]|nr:nucleoside monophosphate kinase [Acidimicrobiia bacterium]